MSSGFGPTQIKWGLLLRHLEPQACGKGLGLCSLSSLRARAPSSRTYYVAGVPRDLYRNRLCLRKHCETDALTILKLSHREVPQCVGVPQQG